MPIEFPCSSCEAKLRVPDGTSGKKAKCPSCQTVNVVPDFNNAQHAEPKPVQKPSFEFPCSSCGAKLRVPDGTSGKKAKCPSCQTINIIPGVASQSPQQDRAKSMPSPLDDPLGLNDADLMRNMENQNWGIDDFAESDNPFQAPHDFDGVPRPQMQITETITPTKLYLIRTLKETFRNFFSNIAAYLITSVAMILSYGVIYAIMFAMFAGMFAMFIPIPVFGPNPIPATTGMIPLFMFPLVLFAMIILGLLGTGFLSCFISIAKTGKASTSVFLKGIKKFLPCLGYGIILWLINIGLSILEQVITYGIMMGVENGNGIGMQMVISQLITILFAILNFWVNFRFMWGFWLIIDQNFSVGNALRITREISKGNVLTGFVIFLVIGFLFGLGLVILFGVIPSFSGMMESVVMVGVLCLCFGLLLMPFFACLYTMMYLLMSGQHPGVRQTEPQW